MPLKRFAFSILPCNTGNVNLIFFPNKQRESAC
jgi:hypothetical protein